MYKYNKYLYLAEEADNKMKYLKIFGGIVLVIVVVLVIKHFVGGSEEHYLEHNTYTKVDGQRVRGGRARGMIRVNSKNEDVEVCKQKCNDNDMCGGFVHYKNKKKDTTICNFKTNDAINNETLRKKDKGWWRTLKNVFIKDKDTTNPEEEKAEEEEKTEGAVCNDNDDHCRGFVEKEGYTLVEGSPYTTAGAKEVKEIMKAPLAEISPNDYKNFYKNGLKLDPGSGSIKKGRFRVDFAGGPIQATEILFLIKKNLVLGEPHPQTNSLRKPVQMRLGVYMESWQRGNTSLQGGDDREYGKDSGVFAYGKAPMPSESKNWHNNFGDYYLTSPPAIENGTAWMKMKFDKIKTVVGFELTPTIWDADGLGDKKSSHVVQEVEVFYKK